MQHIFNLGRPIMMCGVCVCAIYNTVCKIKYKNVFVLMDINNLS